MGQAFDWLASGADSLWDWLTSVSGAWVVSIFALVISLVNFLGDRPRVVIEHYMASDRIMSAADFVSLNVLNVGSRAVPLDHIFLDGGNIPVSRAYPHFADKNPVTPVVLDAFGVLKWDIPIELLRSLADSDVFDLVIAWREAPMILWWRKPKRRTVHETIDLTFWSPPPQST